MIVLALIYVVLLSPRCSQFFIFYLFIYLFFFWGGGHTVLKVREECTFYIRGHGKSGKVREFENFCTKSQGKSGKKIPVENEVSRSTFGFKNCSP